MRRKNTALPLAALLGGADAFGVRLREKSRKRRTAHQMSP